MSGKFVAPLKFNGTMKSITVLLAIFLLLVITFSLVTCNSAITPTTTQQVSPDIENNLVKRQGGSSCNVLSLAISPATVEAGQPVTVMADIVNSGNNDETYKAELKINDIVEVTKNLIIPGGATQRINFLVSKDRPGNYVVTFGNLTGNFATTSKVTSLQTNNNSQPGASTPSCCDTNETNNSSSGCYGTPLVPQYSKQSSSVMSGGSCCGN